MGGVTALAAKAYDLSLKVKPDQAFNYTLVITPEQGSQTAEVDMTMKAEKVEGDKTTFRTKITNVRQDGKPVPQAMAMLGKMSIIQVRNKRGETISSAVEGSPMGNQPVNETNSVYTASLPEKAVNVGDTWAGKDPTGAPATYKFVSVENRGGKEAAVLELTGAGNDRMKIEGPMKMVVDLTTGMTIEATMTATPAGQSKMKVALKQV
jgi:hypothetical protein